MNSKMPWDYHPHLTEDRLTIVANTILDRRNSCLELHDEDAGDTSWGLHCRSFDRCHTTLKKLVLSGEHEWLSLVDGSMKFQFKIGEILFRFYRGDPDKPNMRTLSQDLSFLNQGRFDFDDDYPFAELKWRFAIETGIDGEVTRIVVIGVLGEKDIRCSWDVPLVKPVRVISAIDSVKDSGVEIPSPHVGIPGKKQQSSRSDNDKPDNDNSK